MLLTLRPNEAPRLVHPIWVVIKDVRGVVLAQNEGIRDAFSNNFIGMSQSTVFRGNFLAVATELLEFVVNQFTEASSLLVLENKEPAMHRILPYFDIYTGLLKTYHIDQYPFFDSKGNVTGMGAYTFDCGDELQETPVIENLRPMLTAISQLDDTIRSVSDWSIKTKNTKNIPVLAQVKSLSNQVAFEADKVAQAHSQGTFTTAPWIRDCYVGKIILRTVGNYANLLYQQTISTTDVKTAEGKRKLPPEKEVLYPVISLQIDPQAVLMCHCDLGCFNLALTHALECQLASTATHTDVIVKSLPSQQLSIEISWAFQESNSQTMLGHLKASQECAKQAGVEWLWSKSPRSCITFKLPPHKEPILKARPISSFEQSGIPFDEHHQPPLRTSLTTPSPSSSNTTGSTPSGYLSSEADDPHFENFRASFAPDTPSFS